MYVAAGHDSGSPACVTRGKSRAPYNRKGVPTLDLDALSSAAYGPEAALTVQFSLGAAGLFYILPITFAIVILLGIVFVR